MQKECHLRDSPRVVVFYWRGKFLLKRWRCKALSPPRKALVGRKNLLHVILKTGYVTLHSLRCVALPPCQLLWHTNLPPTLGSPCVCGGSTGRDQDKPQILKPPTPPSPLFQLDLAHIRPPPRPHPSSSSSPPHPLMFIIIPQAITPTHLHLLRPHFVNP